MKIVRRCGLVLAWGLGWSAAAAQEPETVQFESEFGAYSKYVWRGLVLTDRPNFQTSHTVSQGPWALNMWTLGRSGDPRLGQFDEIDFELRWTREVGDWSISPWINRFSYIKDAESDPTLETGISLAREFSDFSIFADGFLDIQDSPGAFYGSFGVESEGEWSDTLGWNWFAAVGWGNRRFGEVNYEVAKPGWVDASAGAFANIQLGPRCTLVPGVTFHRVLDARFRGAVSHRQPTVWSLSLSFSN